MVACAPAAEAREQYLEKKWLQMQEKNFQPLATTTAPALTPVPANPCFTFGCPSLNTACLANTTGPTGVAAALCTVDFAKVTVNLNMATKANAALTITATSLAQAQFVLLQTAGEIQGVNGVFYGVAVPSVNLNAAGTILSVNAVVTCNACGVKTVQAAAKTILLVMPPYLFASMGLPVDSVSTCMATDAAADGTCTVNVNTVVGNPPAPTTDNGGGGAGANVGIIIGAVAGGVVAVLAIAAGVYVYKKRQAQFSTTSRNISSSTATPHTVSGPMSNPSVGLGMNNNFNQGMQMQRPSPVGGYGQNNQNWNNNNQGNNRGWA